MDLGTESLITPGQIGMPRCLPQSVGVGASFPAERQVTVVRYSVSNVASSQACTHISWLRKANSHHHVLIKIQDNMPFAKTVCPKLPLVPDKLSIAQKEASEVATSNQLHYIIMEYKKARHQSGMSASI